MKRFTISVSDEFKAKLERHPHINWPEVIKQGIERRLSVLEKMHSRGEF